MTLQPPFINPTLPFSTEIQGGLKDGMIITVCGRVLSDADRFNINLEYGSDVVLQVNPRYSWLLPISGYVVHNTRLKGKWGWEEHKMGTPFPRGEMFALQIFVTKDSYKIYTNGKLFSEYNHRLPFSNVDRICVVGMVDLNLVTYRYAMHHLNAHSGSLIVPYKTIIYGGVQPGRCIVIQGQMNPTANSIGFSLRRKTGIAFDYSARFDKNVVVCNSYEDGKWGKTEQTDQMPFTRGRPFLVVICCASHEYNVFVDGKQTETYPHYKTLEEIDVFELSGDLQLNFVQL